MKYGEWVYICICIIICNNDKYIIVILFFVIIEKSIMYFILGRGKGKDVNRIDIMYMYMKVNIFFSDIR